MSGWEIWRENLSQELIQQQIQQQHKLLGTWLIKSMTSPMSFLINRKTSSRVTDPVSNVPRRLSCWWETFPHSEAPPATLTTAIQPIQQRDSCQSQSWGTLPSLLLFYLLIFYLISIWKFYHYRKTLKLICDVCCPVKSVKDGQCLKHVGFFPCTAKPKGLVLLVNAMIPSLLIVAVS